jgi:hypothetical protein
MKKMGGFLIVTTGKRTKKGLAGEGRKTKEKVKFKVINPVEILTKE